MRERKYYSGDKVVMQSDQFPEDLNRGFKKGDTAVIKDAIELGKDWWEIDVVIDKNHRNWTVSLRDIKLYKETPLQVERVNHIFIGNFEAFLSMDLTFKLYEKLLKLKEKNKKSFHFIKSKVKFNKQEDIEEGIEVLKGVLKSDFHLE